MPAGLPHPRTCLRFAAVLAACALGTHRASGQEFTLTERDEWSADEAAEPSSPEGRLARIRRALSDGEFERAETQATQWIDRFPRHDRIAEAYIFRGDSERGRENYYEALFDYEFVATNYAGAEVYLLALERELEIARMFAEGKKRKLWGMRIVDASQEAEELLIRIQERMPGSTIAEEAGIALGDFYFERRDMTLAAEAYDLFIDNYPLSPHVRRARENLIKAHLALFKGPQFDAAGLYEARAQLDDLSRADPVTAQQLGADALRQRIDDSVAWKMVQTARWYEQVGDVISAERTLRRMLKLYPRTTAAREGVRIAQALLPKLPKAVQRSAPDYAAYDAAFNPPPVPEPGDRQ